MNRSPSGSRVAGVLGLLVVALACLAPGAAATPLCVSSACLEGVGTTTGEDEKDEVDRAIDSAEETVREAFRVAREVKATLDDCVLQPGDKQELADALLAGRLPPYCGEEPE